MYNRIKLTNLTSGWQDLHGQGYNLRIQYTPPFTVSEELAQYSFNEDGTEPNIDTGGSSGSGTEGGILLGDYDNDGIVGILDIVATINDVLDLDNENHPEQADFNQDGFLNILDVVMLVNHVLDEGGS